MTIRKRLAYATRGFRGGENVTQTLYINEDVSVEFNTFEVDVEKLDSIPFTVDITPYQEFDVEFSSIAEELSVTIELPTENVSIDYISNDVTVEFIDEVNITL